MLELVPNFEPQWIERHGQVVKSGEAGRFEADVSSMNRVFDVYAFSGGAPGQNLVAVLFANITDRKRREANLAFLAEIQDDCSRLTTADAMMQTVGAKIGAYLNLSVCAFVDVDEAQDRAIVPHAWHRADAPDVTGTYRISEFLHEAFHVEVRAGKAVVVSDTTTDERTDAASHAALNLYSFISVPFLRNGQWKFLLNVADSRPRNWREDEIELFNELANRIFPRLERARAEVALRDREVELREAQRIGNIGSWRWDAKTDITTGSDELLRIYGFNPERNTMPNFVEQDGWLYLVISAALETVRLVVEAKSLQVQTISSPIVGTVNGDAGRLQQVIWNLLSNAVKFTPTGGQITIELSSVGMNAQIQVKDTGKGISSDFLPYVFEHFRQEDGATTRKFGGLGLGLAIARQIVEMHGGQIRVDSSGEGQGATFTVLLPLAPHLSELPSSEASSPAMSDLNGIRILVVDDEADSREIVAFVLQQAGAVVTSVSSGIEALQVIEQSAPDVIVSDIGMPEMDGYMLLQQIHSLDSHSDSIDRGKRIPAIALTAYAGEYDRQQAIAAGFQQHIPKPVDPETLVSAIRTLCSGLSNSKTG